MVYVLVPGAWSGEWVWDEVAARLSDKGHAVHSITLSGLNADDHGAGVSLEEHVRDVIYYINSNDLKHVILVGHSYSGLVVGQVAVQAPQLVRHTVFIEAFLPIDGKSLLEVSGLDAHTELRLIKQHVGLWPPPTKEELEDQPHLNPAQIGLLAAKMVGHPGRTVTDPARLPAPLATICATFISSRNRAP